MKTFEHINRGNEYSFEGRTEKYPHFFRDKQGGRLGFMDIISGNFGGQSPPSGFTSTPAPTPSGFDPGPQHVTNLFNRPGRDISGGGQVQDARTGGGGGGQAPSSTDFSNAPLEPTPSGPPAIDFDALIAPALQALDQAESAARSFTEAEIGGIESNLESTKEKAEAETEKGRQRLARTQQREETRTKEAVGEQRRGFSEIQRNLLGRFGTAVSTGAGIIGETGSQVLRNIGSIRTRLQEGINDINLAREAVEETFQTTVRDAERQSQNLKAEARANLQQALATIGAQRGELQSRKMELVNNALQAHQDRIADINARNTAFKQQVFLAREAAQQKLATAASRAAQTAQNIDVQLLQTPFGVRGFAVNEGAGTIDEIPIGGRANLQGFVPGTDDEDVFGQIEALTGGGATRQNQ